ncbi:MAG: hypothetical protein N4A62_15350 [Marinisporobacter sp.]|nr:hypothetical protein [Marinisporobacter sp.]
MKKMNQDDKVEMIFKNDINAMNKLVIFIINKILEDYDKLGGFVGENEIADKGGNSE